MLEVVDFREAAIADRTLEWPAAIVAVRVTFQVAWKTKKK